MATHFQVRINCNERMYAAQAAQAAFDMVDSLEARLSRFRSNSDITRIGDSGAWREDAPERTGLCLPANRGADGAGDASCAFCATPAALQNQLSLPQWSLLPDEQSVLCVSGQLQFDLGAIGKGFALDRMAELLRQWDCSFIFADRRGQQRSCRRSACRNAEAGPAAWVKTTRRKGSFWLTLP